MAVVTDGYNPAFDVMPKPASLPALRRAAGPILLHSKSYDQVAAICPERNPRDAIVATWDHLDGSGLLSRTVQSGRAISCRTLPVLIDA